MNFYSLYIDPGTGSMLFSIVIGIAGVLVFAIRAFWIKFKFLLVGGRSKASASDSMPICIFSEGKRYWSYFEPVCDEFEKREKELWYLTASADDPALSKNYKHVHVQFIGEGNKAISRMNLINADIIMSTTPSLDVYQWKRSKTVKWYVHIPHLPNDLTTYKMFGLDFYDAILASGQYQIDQIRRIENARGIPQKEMVLTGIPFMDSLRLRLSTVQDTKKDNKEPVILLAPSWGKSGLLSLYGSSLIDSLIKTGYKVIIRPHPQSFTSEKEMIDGLMQKYPESANLKWNRDSDNFDVLNEADIMVSDFSGVVFDFSLVFNKPVIYAVSDFDKAPYDCSWDPEELWTFTTLPKIGRELTKDNFGSITDLVDSCLNGSEAAKLAEAREQARTETWCNIGSGAEKVADYLLAKQEELNKSVKYYYLC